MRLFCRSLDLPVDYLSWTAEPGRKSTTCCEEKASPWGALREVAMPVLEHREFDGHEQVVFCHDPLSGLKAIIAIHNTSRGPALGGCRMWPYASEAEALTDVLRLSRGMTYKSALAGLSYGGGKSVVIGDRKSTRLTSSHECASRMPSS